MTITRAKQITADLISRNYNTGNIDELGEYKDIVDAAKEWAQEITHCFITSLYSLPARA